MEQKAFNEIKAEVLESFKVEGPSDPTFNDAEIVSKEHIEWNYANVYLKVAEEIVEYAFVCARNEMEESLRHTDINLFDLSMFSEARALATQKVEELKNYEDLQLKTQNENSR